MQLLVTEKPFVQKNISKYLPNIEADSICNVHLDYKFNYDNFTFPSNPSYEYDKKVKHSFKMVHHRNGQILTGVTFDFNESHYTDFINYSEICIFIDLDHSGVRSTDLFLEHFFGDMKDKYPITFAILDDYVQNNFSKRYEDRIDLFKSSEVKQHQQMHNKVDYYRKKYEIKDYIDFNFNGLMRQYFPTGKLLVTRNTILTLLLLSRYTFTDKMDAVQNIGVEMERNKIGSPISKSEIVGKLVDAKFVSPELFRVTKKGKSFIEQLPAGLKDFDSLMHFKAIEQITDLTHDRIKEEIELYLAKMFEPCLNKD